MSTVRSEPQPPRIPSRYSHLDLIAEGGSGRVYRVRDTVRDLDLALKIVSRAEAVWLRREFETLRHIRHENLVRVYDWGTLDADGAYYTMELLEGGDWGRVPTLPQAPEEVRRILTGLLRGLAHLHSHGELHGDLKPGNVLLGSGAVVKVSDVGMGGGEGGSGVSATPGFAAPEMWEGSKATIQGDLYSVGVMAYEALTGHHPFEGRTIRDVISEQLEGWVPSPRAHGVTLPADLERSIMRALERKPALRQSCADEFLEEMGVQDRVGEILGGRFVGRGRELRKLREYLSASAINPPTVAFICGAPGVGKTAVITELALQCLSDHQKVIHISGSDFPRALCGLLLGDHGEPSPKSAETSTSSIAEALWRLGTERPVLVWLDPPGSDETTAVNYLVQVGRFLGSLALEREKGSRVLLMMELHEPLKLPDCELVTLAPLDPTEADLLVRGFLGNFSSEATHRERLHTASGGIPSAILDLITDLIVRGVLTRADGAWGLRDVEGLRELRYTGTPVRMQRAWGQLGPREKRVLTALALFEQGIGIGSLAAVADGVQDAIQVLSAKGWTTTKGKRVATASQGVRSAILDLATPAERAELEALILADDATDIDSEDRASGLLRHPDLPGALQLGLASTEASFASRDFARAAERGQACLQIAMARGDRESALRAMILVADSLHRLGRYDDAKRVFLEECRQLITSDEPLLAAQRERLLGSIYLEQGDLGMARDHLSRSIELADANGDLSLSLQSQADLADLDWRYGDEELRTKTIARVKDVIARIPEGQDLRDERAALTYQLGSALIINGRREEAAAVLQSALTHNPGDYWRMRIANAAGAAEYYLGHFDAALRWSDEARRLAEASGSDSYKARIHSNRAGVYYGLGRFRDAVEHHRLSAMWARRTGSMLEYEAASSGASINLTITGRYEEALKWAREAQGAAQQTGDMPELAKSHELEALANFHIGEFEEAERLVTLGLAVARESDAEVMPRLEWLAARIACVRGNWARAKGHLKAALTILEHSRDWEDLPGVQVELNSIAFKEGDPGFDPGSLIAAAVEAEGRGAVLVFLRAAVAVGEVLLEVGSDHVQGRELLDRALGQAEMSGAAELSWQLSYLIGEADTRRSDLKSASSRYRHAMLGLREIADLLSPGHRASYLRTHHARALLSRISGAS